MYLKWVSELCHSLALVDEVAMAFGLAQMGRVAQRRCFLRMLQDGEYVRSLPFVLSLCRYFFPVGTVTASKERRVKMPTPSKTL